LTIGSGIWLSNTGKPYKGSIFNIHKLIALAAVILTVVLVRSLLKDVDLCTYTGVLIILSGLFVLILFITGALLSNEKLQISIILFLHRISSILVLLTTGAVIYLLLFRK
jgi:heme A synthase